MPYVGKKPADIIATAVDSTTGAFSGNVTAGGTLGVTGETTLATHLNMGDNDKIKLGASGDLELFHDGTNSNLKDTGTGSLNLIASTKVQVQGVNGETMAIFNEDGSAELRHNDVKKFETTSSGVTVTGSLLTTNIYGASDANTGIQWEGSDVLTFHTGGAENIQLTSNSIVFNQDSADMDFRIESNNNAPMFFVDAGNDRIGINQDTPLQPLHLTDADFAFARFQTTAVSKTGIDFGQHQDGSGHINLRDADVLKISTGDSERARFLGPSTSHSGFFKISDAGTYQSSTGGFHEIRSSSSNQAGVVIGATHASYSSNVISIISQRQHNSGFNFIEAFSNNTGDTEFKARGDGEVFADGSFNSGGADYAEMFEWKDGNTSSEDRVGKTVVLDGNQIRLSTSDDAQATIIGVVSARPVVLGDAQNEKWKDKYETDSYGRYVLEDYTQTEWTIVTSDGAKELKTYQTDMIPSDVTVPDDAIVTSKDENGDNLKRRKLNTAFDESKTYIPREDRKEFSAIGLVGKLRVSVGQIVGDRWIKMREISDTVHEYLVR